MDKKKTDFELKGLNLIDKTKETVNFRTKLMSLLT